MREMLPQNNINCMPPGRVSSSMRLSLSMSSLPPLPENISFKILLLLHCTLIPPESENALVSSRVPAGYDSGYAENPEGQCY